MTINKILKNLLFLSIILLPFDHLPYFHKYLHEMATNGAFYPLFIGLTIWMPRKFKAGKLNFPDILSSKLLGLFLIWIIISGITNIMHITHSEVKGRMGYEKYLVQFLLILVVSLIPFYVNDIFSNLGNLLNDIRESVLISFLIVGFYSIFEFGYLFHQGWGLKILQVLNPYIHSSASGLGHDLYPGRIRSVSGEASWFSMNLGFIFPWILSYTYSLKKIRLIYFILMGYFFLLVSFSFSRTGYVIIDFEFILFTLALIVQKNKIKWTKPRIINIVVVLSLFIIFLGFHTFKISHSTSEILIPSENIYNSLTDNSNLSNKARYGMQFGAIEMGLDHPIFGVGFGQYGFYIDKYIPHWAKDNYEVKIWLDKNVGTPWPPVHNIYARIAGELGFIGLLLWVSIWINIFFKCFIKYRGNSIEENDILGLSLTISIIGVILCGMNFDSFRLLSYWIVLGIAWVYIKGVHTSQAVPRVGDI